MADEVFVKKLVISEASKYTKINFFQGSVPGLAGGAHSAPSTPSSGRGWLFPSPRISLPRSRPLGLRVLLKITLPLLMHTTLLLITGAPIGTVDPMESLREFHGAYEVVPSWQLVNRNDPRPTLQTNMMMMD